MNLTPQIPHGMNIDELGGNRRRMNKRMIQYIEQVRMQPSMYIRERGCFDRLLGKAPTYELNQGNIMIMYKDKWGAFIKTMLMGMDFDFLMLDVVVITFMDRETRRHPDVTSRVALAIMMAYMLDNMLFWLMSYSGRRNLSKHTLTDESFLI